MSTLTVDIDELMKTNPNVTDVDTMHPEYLCPWGTVAQDRTFEKKHHQVNSRLISNHRYPRSHDL